MYQQPSGAAPLNTWGNQQQQQQSFGYTLDEGSSDEYTDSEEESEDDMPLAMSSWGEQTTTKEGTTEYNVSAEGWAALIDPNFKVGPGGIGSGNLHRRGGNYKPVEEEYILNHRLKKGGPMPGSGKKKKKSRSKSASATPPSSRSGRGRSRGGFPRPSSSASSSRAPSRYGREPPSNNAWGAQQLTDKPFWEQPTSAAPPPTNYGSGASASKYAPAGGAAASRYASQQQTPQQPQQQWGQQQQTPQQPQQQWSQQQQTPQQPQQQWGQQEQQQQPPQQWGQQEQQQQPPQQWGQQEQQQQQPQQWGAQQNGGSAASRYATESTQGSSASRYADSGSGASKWASGSSASKYASPMATSSCADSIYASEEDKQSTLIQQKPSLPNAENILSINISFMPGVYATLNVPNQTHIDYNKLVKDFVSHHRLQMIDEAKRSFTANVQKLVELEYAKRQQR